jgi:hypothetical protein
MSLAHAAGYLAQGVNLLGELDYFHYWPYQSAFVAWMALFIRLFGADVVFFKLTNCLFSALSTLLVYIAIRFFSRLKDGQNKRKYDFARALVLIVLYFLISLSLRVCEGKGADSFTIQKTIVPFWCSQYIYY